MLRLNTIFLLVAASVLAVIHLLALEFYLYWRFLWLDIPMHILGGATVALGIFALKDLGFPWPARWLQPLPVISFALIVALLWENYEIFIGIPIELDHLLDTPVDLVMGLLGAIIGYQVGRSIFNLQNAV